jgi:hypothetical protein
MSAQHTPGLWWLNAAGDAIVSERDGRICIRPDHMKQWNWPANAARIVQCVNAHDELVAELRYVRNGLGNWPDTGPLIEEIDAAIAKATGEQS